MLLLISSAIRSLSHPFPWLNGPVEIIATYFIFLSPLIFLPLWIRSNGLRPLLTALFGALLAIGFTVLIGHLWDRPRPFVLYHLVPLIPHAADASFPSDHTAALGALTIAAWLGWKRLGICMGILLVLVSFARVYVRVHYVSDVVGGAVLGALCSVVVWWILGKPFFTRVITALDTLLHKLELRRT